MKYYLLMLFVIPIITFAKDEHVKIDSLQSILNEQENELHETKAKLEECIEYIKLSQQKLEAEELSNQETENSNDKEVTQQNKSHENNTHSLINKYSHSVWLSISILIFGVIIISGIFYTVYKQKNGWGSNSIQITGISLIIIAGLFLITAGYSEKQIAPIIGLLGTIAGYLLGKTNKENN